jgi:hypothetical protein
MWYYGNDKKKSVYNIPEEIHEAFDYFFKKYGIYPDTCELSIDSEEVKSPLVFDGQSVKVSRNKGVLPRVIWIGFDDDREIK